jgi:hypothetical protein
MRGRAAIRALGIWGIAAAVSVLASASTQDRPSQDRVLRDAAAMVKLVPVRVLGKDGRPVTDLRKEDFALYEDGQRKTITEFEVHAQNEAGMTAAPEEGVVLGSPLLFEIGTDAVYMRLPTKQGSPAGGKPGVEEPSLMGLYRLIPKAAHPIVGEVSAGARKIMAVLPFEIRPRRPGEEPILDIAAKLISRTGSSEMPLEVAVSELKTYEGRPDVLLAEISLPVLTAGSYELEIALGDIGTDRRAAVRKPLIIH